VSAARRIAAVASRLDERARALERQKDSRCVFTHAYMLMTRRLEAELETSGLADPDWVAELAEAFVGRYFYALDEYDAGREPPAAWQTVFATICSRKTSVIEDLVFGVYAHIVRDLPHTLAEVGTADAHGRSRIADHHIVTAIVGHAIEEIQASTAHRYGPYVSVLDRLGAQYDEALTDYGIRLSRGMAWYNALRLVDERSTAAAAAAVEESPAFFVREVMSPPVWSVRTLLRASRWLTGHLRRWPAASA
jgi:hypothetical protein